MESYLYYYNDGIFILDNSNKIFYKYNLTTQTWLFLKNYGGNIIGSTLFSNYAYIFTNSSVFELNLINLSLEVIQMPNCPNGFYYSITSDSNEMFMFGGYNDVYTNTFVRINLENSLGTENLICYVTENFNYPAPRLSHSMVQINFYLYLFGGESSGVFFNDLWAFDIKAQSWSQSISKGTGPSTRIDYGIGSSGDALLIWGGEDSTGYLNDMYVYNRITTKWLEIIPGSSSIPSTRKGICVAFKMPEVYIHGGETIYETSNELWKYDFRTNLYTLVSNSPAQLAYGNCQLENNVYYYFCGSSGGQLSQKFYQYNISSHTWTVHSTNSTCYVQGIQYKIGNYYVDFGGQKLNIESNYEFYMFNTSFFYTAEIEYTPFNAGQGYFGSVIHFHNGGKVDMFNNVVASRPETVFGRIDLVQLVKDYGINLACSPGSYWNSSACVICPEGTYAEGFGNTYCPKCLAGKYNAYQGATSIRQCYPCPHGTFSNKPGSAYCLHCPKSFLCPIGSSNYQKFYYNQQQLSIEPKNYKGNNYSEAILNFEIYFSVTIFILLLAVLTFCHKKIELIDLYKEYHTFDLGDSIKLTKNKVGGIFSLIFICLSIILFVVIMIGYLFNNVQEMKALQPYSVIKQEVSVFLADIEVVVTFVNYQDNCATNAQCNPGISMTAENFSNNNNQSYSCEYQDGSCIINYKCYGCDIGSKSSVLFYLNEDFSFCTEIMVNLSSSSSIPESISSESISIAANDQQIFGGGTPTQFYYVMTPSLFTSSVKNFPKQTTGYHVVVNSNPTPGSQYTLDDISSIYGLSTIINLDLDTSGLLTNRYESQSFLILASGLLGSVAGLQGFISYFMRRTEITTKTLRKKHKANANFRKTKFSRKVIRDSVYCETTITNIDQYAPNTKKFNYDLIIR